MGKKLISKYSKKNPSKNLKHESSKPEIPQNNSQNGFQDGLQKSSENSQNSQIKITSGENIKEIENSNLLPANFSFEITKNPQQNKMEDEKKFMQFSQNSQSYFLIFEDELFFRKLYQKLHFCLYLGFFLVILIFSFSAFLEQDVLLQKLGFIGNSQSRPQICDLVDFGETDCRLSAGFASPNHLAAYLLMILPVFWHDFFEE